MKVGVTKETTQGERRVALVPDTVSKLSASGIEILIESGAGEAASFTDAQYQEAGADLSPDAASICSHVDIVLKVQGPTLDEVDLISDGATLIAFLQPMNSLDLIRRLMEKSITSFSMDTVPRIARAQSMDALSSMSSIAGYKAAIIAATSLAKYFPMMITAAGTYAPAKGLVLGAGVAGLQAIATARRLGAVLQAFDVRPVVKEQVESLGAKFVGLAEDEQAEDAGGYAKELAEESQKRERELLHTYTKDADFVITTALIPGRPAPLLITEDMVKDMGKGSVIVDIAAESGGNCALTEPGTEVIKHGVIINGPLNLPSSMAVHASQMYARNISSLLLHMVRENQLHLDFEDTITQGCCITHAGKVIYGPAQSLIREGHGS